MSHRTGVCLLLFIVRSVFVIILFLTQCRGQSKAEAQSDWQPCPEIVCCCANSCTDRNPYAHTNGQTG